MLPGAARILACVGLQAYYSKISLLYRYVQTGMIKTQQVQDSGVQIMEMTPSSQGRNQFHHIARIRGAEVIQV